MWMVIETQNLFISAGYKIFINIFWSKKHDKNKIFISLTWLKLCKKRNSQRFKLYKNKLVYGKKTTTSMHSLTPELFHSSQPNPQQLQHWKASRLALLVACSSLSPQEILFIPMNSLNKLTISSSSFSSASYSAVFAPNKHGWIGSFEARNNANFCFQH